jgi:hypothetical protein
MAAVARGDKPWPSSTGDRHHFVPEFILRRFCGRTSAGKRLFVLDKNDGSIIESTPKEAGYEDRLYALNTIDGQHDGFLEGLFGLAENYAATSLQTLVSVSPTPALQASDRGNVAHLIAAQEQRVPGALRDLRLNMIIGASTFAAVEMANVKGSRRRQRLGHETCEAMVAGNVSVEPSTDAVLEQALISLANTAQTIFRLPWTLLRAKPDADRFICSDRPLTMFDPTPPTGSPRPGGSHPRMSRQRCRLARRRVSESAHEIARRSRYATLRNRSNESTALRTASPIAGFTGLHGRSCISSTTGPRYHLTRFRGPFRSGWCYSRTYRPPILPSPRRTPLEAGIDI